MINNHFSREELLSIIETDHLQYGEASVLARMALAAMDSEPVAALKLPPKLSNDRERAHELNTGVDIWNRCIDEVAKINGEMIIAGRVDGLHPSTMALVNDFATALAEKLHTAELKYGYSNAWTNNGWMTECQAEFHRHIAKGDPRDVAAYCAFMWYHGWKTEAAQPAPEYPETLPCPVLLDPGLRFGKGIKTSTMLAALARRAVHESDMAALSPEERAEFQARIEDFKALIAQPAPVVVAEAQSRAAFEQWCTVNIERNKWHPEFYAHLPAREQWAAWEACRAAMLQAGNAPVNGVTAGKPLTIILPDISSKAFWSGSGKTEVFHPETYRRWVKEAIERGCIIACIDVEVK